MPTVDRRRPEHRGRAGMSVREYAAHAGLSKSAVEKALATGRVVRFADGSIDPTASDALFAQGTNPAMRRGARAEEPQEVPAGGVEAPITSIPPYLQARAANEMLKAQERRLRLQQHRGELVDRRRSLATIYQLARQERDSWVNWPPRVAALMAAELGVTAHLMQTVLTRHVREHLDSLADVKLELR